MNEKEIIEFLKQNLRIETKVKGGEYGNPYHIEIKIFLKGELITEDSDSLPN